MSKYDYINQNAKKEIMFNLNEQYFFLVAAEMSKIHQDLSDGDFKSALNIIETLFNEQEYSIEDYDLETFKKLQNLIESNKILIKEFESIEHNRSMNRMLKFRLLNENREILESKIRRSYSFLIGTMDRMGILFKKESVNYIKPIFENLES